MFDFIAGELLGFYDWVISRISRTEFLLTAVAVYLVVSGRVPNAGEAVALVAAIAPYILGRSYHKAKVDTADAAALTALAKIIDAGPVQKVVTAAAAVAAEEAKVVTTEGEVVQ